MAVGTLAIYKNLRDRLLNYLGSDGNKIGTLLSGNLYIGGPPQGAVFPYGIMRLINAGTDGATYGVKEIMTLELEFVGFPANRTAQRAVEQLADLADQALMRYSFYDSGIGLIYSRARLNRDTLPPAATNAAMVRSLFRIDCWPKYLLVSGTFV